MLCLLMHRHVGALQIFIRCGNIRVTSLITGDNNSFSVGQVTNTGIFQGIELVTVCELQFCTNLVKVISVHTCGYLLARWPEAFTELIIIVGRIKDAKVKHRLDERIIQSDHAILSVLADTGPNKHLLFFQVNITQPDI